MRSLCRKILELDDDNVKHRQKLVNPCMQCCTGTYFMCDSNEGLTGKGTGNGTQCIMFSVKLKKTTIYMWNIRNKTKVWTVCAYDVELVEFGHFPKSQKDDTLEMLLTYKRQAHLENVTGVDFADITSIKTRLNKFIRLQMFKLEQTLCWGCPVKLSPNGHISEQQLMKCNLTPIPV